MGRDANFSASIAEIQVKEERVTDKSDLILIFRYWYCWNSRKKRGEKLTKILINFDTWIAKIQLLFWLCLGAVLHFV